VQIDDSRRGWGSFRRWAVAVAILAVVALGATLGAIQPQRQTGTSSTGHPPPPVSGLQTYPPGTKFVRIRALDSNSAWSLEGSDAQHVLSQIADLKPDVLERFLTGPQNVDALVPVAPGSPPMTAGEFLNLSMKACSCYIIPRLSLFDYDSGKLFDEAKSLITLPISPKMQYLSLDEWGTFSQNHTPDEIKGMFQQLYSQGWAGIGVNECNGYSPSYGYATFSDFCVAASDWRPNARVLSSIMTEPNIELALLYIDFPQPMLNFSTLQPDEEAKMLAQRIAPAQSAGGFFFVYPIAQDFWNSSARLTSPTSPFKGHSLYYVMKGLMARYDSGLTSSTSTPIPPQQLTNYSLASHPGPTVRARTR
jgi:hypothetical protein